MTEVQREPSTVPDWIRTTSTKILRIGAGLKEFLRWTDKILFTAEPCHEPDPQFVEELTALLKKIDVEYPIRIHIQCEAQKQDPSTTD